MKTKLAWAAAVLILVSWTGAEPSEAYAASTRAKLLLRTAITSSGKPLQFPSTNKAEVAALEVVIPAGQSTGWHTHAHSGFGYVLAGRLQVTLTDSSRREFGPGEAFAEVVEELHNGTALGKEDVKLVAFFLCDSGKAVSEKPLPRR